VPQARDDGFLLLLLGSLPRDLRFVLDFRHPSWAVREIADKLAEQGVARVNDWEGDVPFRYIRLREPPYSEEALAEWAAGFRAAGVDIYAYFLHEDDPRGALYAERVVALAGESQEGAARSDR